MKIKKKLRDVTAEEYEQYKAKICPRGENDCCKRCMFKNVMCRMPSFSSSSWVLNKDLYSDKFLDQEIEIEIPDIITKEEKKYLENVIKPLKNKVRSITKRQSENSTIAYIHISIDNSDIDCSFDNITLNYSKADTAYANMELNREYKLEELGLFEEEE